MDRRFSRKSRSNVSLFGIDAPVSFLRTRAVLAGLVVVLVWIGVFAGREWARRSEVESEIVRIKGEIAQIESASNELEETLKVFVQPETVEQEARRRLNLARPGETVVVLPDEASAGSVAVHAEAIGAEDKTSVVVRRGTGPVANVIAWWSYFFGGK